MRLRPYVSVGLAVAIVASSAAACKSGSSSNSSSGGSNAGKTLIVSSDLPLQGASADASKATNQAIELYLSQVGYKAGDYKIKFQPYDDSTAAKGAWDDATCAKNATDHVNNAGEVAVMGTYNSGCAQIEVPVLNQAPNGGMLMVSHANTYPGLTIPWAPGEPDKYYPTGKRNYARVATTDNYQGTAMAQYAANDLGVKRCLVLNDNQSYGQGVAKAFADAAKKVGITVLADEAWDSKQPSYAAIFQKYKAQNPDCVYLGGIYDNNGGQLVKDKVSVLGNNTKVKLLAPDGFTGYPQLDKQPEAQGMYMSFAGLATDQLVKNGGAAAKLIDAYKAKYGEAPPTNYALYGVAAMQVILQAISKSDGTRKGVVDAVFSGSGIDIPASESMLGKEIKIDPKTGDTNNRDITILNMKNNNEGFVKAITVS